MNTKLLTEHHLEFLSFTGGCTDSSESTLVKMPHCWKSHVPAHMLDFFSNMMYFCVVKFFLSLLNSANPDEMLPYASQNRTLDDV